MTDSLLQNLFPQKCTTAAVAAATLATQNTARLAKHQVNCGWFTGRDIAKRNTLSAKSVYGGYLSVSWKRMECSSG